MENNYFFIDGSSLLSDIRKFKIGRDHIKDNKFNILKFSRSFLNEYNLKQFHSGSYRRIVFYFVKNDTRLIENIEMPDFTKPRIIDDIQIKYCGKRISHYKKAEEWLENRSAPSYVKDSLYKSEKAVDTQICCDSLVLLSLNKLSRLFLYTNDYDFIPLCQSIKMMGANVNLIRLFDTRVNKDLVFECDAYFTFHEEQVEGFFGYKKPKSQ